MMRFIHDGRFYKAVKISGPKHNLLAIALSENCDKPSVEALPSEEPALIESEDVFKQVTTGLRQANDELGASYTIEVIQFVPSDTPSASIYCELTKAILREVHKQGL